VKSALITGITGQDGQYLAEFLLEEGYTVFGLVRGQRNPNLAALRRDHPSVQVVLGDVLDDSSIARAIDVSAPDEVYNLAAISFVQYSFEHPRLTAEVTGIAVMRILEALRRAGAKRTRFYQASSSEMFGAVTKSPQDESTVFHPRSPYGSAKVFAHHTTVNYREAYGMFALGGILFNHESPRRGLEFVTRKISYHAAAIKLGRLKVLELGNLAAVRDWGFAGDYVRAMYLMMQKPAPVDYVIGTGETHSVAEFAELAFAHVGLNWRDYVRSNPEHNRPADVLTLRADSRRARAELAWEPTVTFRELVAMMVEHDLRLVRASGE
jgi:GDPmannose 4,6-dehydratase